MNKRTENTSLSPDLLVRLAKVDRFAVEQLADFDGPSIFNPMIGRSAGDTCNRLQDALCFLTNLLDGEHDLKEGRDGLALICQTMWAAAQYEAFRANEKTGAI